MEISRQQFEDVIELRVRGRLDSYWAEFFATAVTEVIQEGAHHLRLDLSEVNYLSSAGIGVLVRFYKHLHGIQGSLVVFNASERVSKVLQLCGLEVILLSEARRPAPSIARPAGVRQIEAENATYEIFELAPGTSLTCRAVGDPELLWGCRFDKQHSRTMSFPESSFAVGLGAFGNDFEECRSQFGEFLAVAGAAAYLPTDGTNVPDYMLAAKSFAPQVEILYCLACEGQFAQLARFEAKREPGVVTLSELVDACLRVAGREVAGIVIVAEALELTGAALRRSPALGGASATPFQHPEIREWLSFSPERTHTRSLSVVAGVAARSANRALDPLLRRLGTDSWPAGHFHAAAFPYQPLQRGVIDLTATVRVLFEAGTLRAVLHLLNDDREFDGAGQSEFIRGACWIGPVSEIAAERS